MFFSLPWRLLALALVHVGGGEFWGRTTGAKALFCLTAAETMLAGEKEKMPEELLQLDARLVDDAMVGLDGTTGRGETGREGCLCGIGEGKVREEQTGMRVEERSGGWGVREKVEGRGQVNGMNRKGLVNG